jgi:alkylation response protein AidB-like acyl-CoA dehydrogenase
MSYDLPIRRADTLFNDAWLPEETKQIRKQVREFADDVVRPVAHKLNTTPESRDAFPHKEMKAIADAGIYKIPYIKAVGGLGLEFPTLATLTVLEELGYYSPGLASALYDGQAILVGKTLERAKPELRDQYLPSLIRGEWIGSFATSEPEASTDLSVETMQTIATKVEGGWKINGRKRWITNSCVADYILVLCKTGDGLSMLFAKLKAPGVKVFDPDLKMGNHAQLTSDIEFTDAFVPEDHIVGEVNGGLSIALAALAVGRMGIGAIGVAMAQAAFDFSTTYMCKRKIFGKELACMQHWQYQFADHAVGIEQARTMYQKAGWIQDIHGKSVVEGAMAKLTGSRLAVDVARDAIQVCGGYGFAREMLGSGEVWPLESIYRDAKIGEIYEGANEIQKWVIARNIFGRNFTG